MLAEVFNPEDAIDPLYRAILAVSSADTLESVLQQIADSGRDLVGADYAAIDVSEELRSLSTLITSGLDQDIAHKIAQSKSGKAFLNRLVQEKLPIRRSGLRNDPSISASFPTEAEVMDSVLGVPCVADGTVVGNIYLANKLGAAEFSLRDQHVVEMLAAHAAMAIRKAHLLEVSNHRSQQLERRNAQLAALNKATMAITSELTLEKVLQQIVDSLREMVNAEYSALGVPGADGRLETFVHSGMSSEEVQRMPHLPQGKGLLGAIIREQRPIRTARVADDPRSIGFPEGHPPMSSFMGIPIRAGGQILGNLYMTNKIDAAEFTAIDQELVEMLAAHAAIVIQNSRLYEQVGRLAVIAERARIGMDLHDGVIQSIYAVGLTLESVRLALPLNPDEADQMLVGAIEGLNDTIRDIRNFILDLRPHRFSGNLDQGVSRLVREFQANTMVPVALEMSLESGKKLPAPVTRAIFLTTQEALANIARHARASSVLIQAQFVDSVIELKITDDGRGFDTKSQVQSVGHGLSNMRARAESLQGTFSLRSNLGEGTCITLALPYAK